MTTVALRRVIASLYNPVFSSTIVQLESIENEIESMGFVINDLSTLENLSFAIENHCLGYSDDLVTKEIFSKYIPTTPVLKNARFVYKTETTISTEGIKDTIVNMLKAIQRFFSSIWEKISNFFKSLFSSTKKQEAKNEDLMAKAKNETPHEEPSHEEPAPKPEPSREPTHKEPHSPPSSRPAQHSQEPLSDKITFRPAQHSQEPLSDKVTLKCSSDFLQVGDGTSIGPKELPSAIDRYGITTGKFFTGAVQFFDKQVSKLSSTAVEIDENDPFLKEYSNGVNLLGACTVKTGHPKYTKQTELVSFFRTKKPRTDQVASHENGFNALRLQKDDIIKILESVQHLITQLKQDQQEFAKRRDSIQTKVNETINRNLRRAEEFHENANTNSEDRNAVFDKIKKTGNGIKSLTVSFNSVGGKMLSHTNRLINNYQMYCSISMQK